MDDIGSGTALVVLNDPQGFSKQALRAIETGETFFTSATLFWTTDDDWMSDGDEVYAFGGKYFIFLHHKLENMIGTAYVCVLISLRGNALDVLQYVRIEEKEDNSPWAVKTRFRAFEALPHVLRRTMQLS